MDGSFVTKPSTSTAVANRRCYSRNHERNCTCLICGLRLRLPAHRLHGGLGHWGTKASAFPSVIGSGPSFPNSFEGSRVFSRDLMPARLSKRTSQRWFQGPPRRESYSWIHIPCVEMFHPMASRCAEPNYVISQPHIPPACRFSARQALTQSDFP